MNLTFENLAVGYRARGRRVRCVARSLFGALAEGKRFVLLGANGSGKTTLLRTLAGLLTPLEGTITLAGKPLSSFSPSARARIFSLYLGANGIFPGLTVKELLEISLSRERQAKERIATIVEQFRIGSYLPRSLSELSDGERKRVLVARAFLHPVPFLFLDEPLSHLDLWQKEELLELIATKAKGRSVLLTSHDLSALAIAEEVWVLCPGGPLNILPQEVASDPHLVRSYLKELYPQKEREALL